VPEFGAGVRCRSSVPELAGLLALCHNLPDMFRGLGLTLVLISVGIKLPTCTG
jgi:hypothetical protein